MARVWHVEPGGEPILAEIPHGDVVTHAIDWLGGGSVDYTKVVFRDRLCRMAVDDLGHEKELPINEFATRAYHAACRPGTTHVIRGRAVIFDGLLS